MNYTGDVSVEEVWAALSAEDKAYWWMFVRRLNGLSLAHVICQNLASHRLISWQEFPHMEINPNFSQMIMAQTLGGQAIQKDWPLYFLCRSGVRSQSAAAAMVASGFEKCFNILHGFEGVRDHDGHRGIKSGWKAAGLPWVQG